MVTDVKVFIQQLTRKLNTFDKQSAAIQIDELIEVLKQNPAFLAIKDGEKILHLVRQNRMFDLMQKLAEVLIQTGLQSFRIRRQYAQSLIDTDNYTSATSILNELAADITNAGINEAARLREYSEVQGLIGRLYKQQYVNAAKLNLYDAQLLNQALKSYYSVYETNPGEYLFHGKNTVALLYRAEKDNIKVSGFPDYKLLAKEILMTIEDKESEKETLTWDLATAAEACVALNRPREAEKWTAYYAADRASDAFDLASELRQFEDVWQLDQDTEMGKRVLPILRTELLKREGGTVVINADEIQKQSQEDIPYEKNFGNNVFIDFTDYKKGYASCLAVGRIGSLTPKGTGTGFLLKGETLHPAWGDEKVLVTNNHVVSNDPDVQSKYRPLNPEEALIVFEALDKDEVFHVGSILWYSPPHELDVTIIRFSTDEMERLEYLTRNLIQYEISSRLPVLSGDSYTDSRLYLIGYPRGGPLQFSMQDNQLLDWDDTRIHYRASIDYGSSGSPVFNQQWELVGIHHSGSNEMKRLNGMEGTYEANEAISMLAVKQKLSQALDINDLQRYDTVEHFIRSGNRYELAEKYDEALKIYAEGHKRFPDAYEFLKRKADVFYSKGDFNQHLESLERYNQEKNRVTLDKNLTRNLVIRHFATQNHPFYGELIWPVNPRMNVILGKNGYGKSHLLTILLGLLQNNIQKTREFSSSGSVLSISISDENTSSATELEKILNVEREREDISELEEEAQELQNTIVYSDKGLESLIGQIPVLAIPDSRFIDKSADLVSRSKETIDIIQDSAFHFLYQKPYTGLIENALYRVCQVYSERSNKEELLVAISLIEKIFYRLTGEEFILKKIESTPSTEYKILVKTEGAEELPIQKVSQGTLSVISILLVIYNYLRARYKKEDVKDEDVANQSAIVFIDEIDAHLHPLWQQKIINIVRETFPSVQFFITGHSPLIVAGCKTGEVAVLRKATPGFELDFFEHDFIGYQPGELYKQIFEIESYDEIYLKYNSLLPFKENYEKEIFDLNAKKNISEGEIQKLEKLCNDVYYMNVVAQKNDEFKNNNALFRAEESQSSMRSL